MKLGDKVEVIDIDTDFPEENQNWMKCENEHAYLKYMEKIEVGDILEIFEYTNMYSIKDKYPAVILKGYQYWHTIKRFKLIP